VFSLSPFPFPFPLSFLFGLLGFFFFFRLLPFPCEEVLAGACSAAALVFP
jgi:hypothetical protein